MSRFDEYENEYDFPEPPYDDEGEYAYYEGDEGVTPPEPDNICKTCDGTGEFPVDHLCKDCSGKGYIDPEPIKLVK
ncbi:MAG: hypothetical protein LAO08_06530 [Acidobacteriia bacterium]|nr:hypothetical protein [Terriglobia bacterium]